MKFSMECPLCKSNNIVINQEGNSILRVKSNAISARGYYARISRYVCCNCGNIEEWIDKGEQLKGIREYYKK